MVNPALISAGLQFAGGLLRSRDERRAARRAQRLRLNHFADLRIAAERGNVNFLTALASGQFPGPAQLPSVPYSAGAALFDSAISYMADVYEQRREAREAQRHREAQESAEALLREAVRVRPPETEPVFTPVRPTAAAVSPDVPRREPVHERRDASPAVFGPEPLMNVRTVWGDTLTINPYALPEDMRRELRGGRLMNANDISHVFGYERAEQIMTGNVGRVERQTGFPGVVFEPSETHYPTVVDRIETVPKLAREALRFPGEVVREMDRRGWFDWFRSVWRDQGRQHPY